MFQEFALKKCPFCGGPVKLGIPYTILMIECKVCCLEMRFECAPRDIIKSTERAIEKWNTRYD